MSLFQLIGIALTTTIVCTILKQFKPEYALLALLTGGALVLLGITPQLAAMIDAVRRMAASCGIDGKYVEIVVKTAGIACICSIAASMCRDAGQSALGNKIELCGRLTILALSMPVISELYAIIIQCIQ